MDSIERFFFAWIREKTVIVSTVESSKGQNTLKEDILQQIFVSPKLE